MTAKPLWGYILIRELPQTKVTKSGIHMPDEVAKNTRTAVGEIVSAGTGSLAFDGSPIEIDPTLRNPGTKVQFKKYEAEQSSISPDLWLVEQRQIIAVLFD